jgi:hypothetical protein
MKNWMSKTVKRNSTGGRDALFGKEIADDLMAQITGGQGKSGCHAKLNIGALAQVQTLAVAF